MGLTKLIRNIKYLSKINLKSEINQDTNYDVILDNLKSGINQDINYDVILDNLKYEIFDELKNISVPKIKNVYETINDLVTQNASICRFGDGEFNLIDGKDIPMQKASPHLSKRLEEVLSSKNEKIFIAIPKILYSSKNNIRDISKNFWRNNGEDFRRKIENYIDCGQQYYAAETTIAFSIYKNFDVDKYFKDISKIWAGKDITVVCGKSVFNKIEYNIFDCAKSTEYILAPSINAFEDYDNIFKNCGKIPKNNLVVIILGPAAKVLAYDMANAGYQALDLGHLAKSFDWYKKQRTAVNMQDAVEFFAPD